MLPFPKLIGPQSEKSAPSVLRWHRLGLAAVAGGFALQLGTLPAAASFAESEFETSRGMAEAIAAPNNVASNNRIPRRGDPRPR